MKLILMNQHQVMPKLVLYFQVRFLIYCQYLHLINQLRLDQFFGITIMKLVLY